MRRITFSIPWPLTGAATRDVWSFAFRVALVSWLGFYLLENISPGFISIYFNLNSILWAAMVTGVMSTLWPMVVPEEKNETRRGWREYTWLALVVGVTIAVIWHTTRSIGPMVNVIAPLAGLIVLGLGLLVYNDHDDKSGHQT